MKSTVTGNSESIKKILEKKPQYRECLFSRGYFITDDPSVRENDYPFYGEWTIESINGYRIFIHKDQDYCIHKENGVSFIIIGHAYNPFNDVYEEKTLLKNAAAAYFECHENFFESINDWTGIFCVFVFDKNIIGVQDCAGIKALYYGAVNDNICFTSHPQLVADIYGLKMDPFIEKLVANRFYNIGNRYLPGDLSPFAELKRIGANVYINCNEKKDFSVHRFYPVQ